MSEKWIANLCPFLHFDNARTNTYEHNISIVAWNVKSILDYLEIEPTHRFCINQVTLLEGFRRLFPNYWDALHERILEGRIEIVGGTYVMPDLVLPDGESIVRQFLYGIRYIREELGVEVKTGWAIDSAGHCSQMPQILRQSGIDSYYFWRGMKFEAPTEFVWIGPDGSRVNAVWLSKGFDCASWLSENTREAFTTLLEIIDDVKEIASSKNIFIPVGGNLVPPLPHLGDIVKQWNTTFPDMTAVIATPREFIERIKTVQSHLPVITGTMDSGRFSRIQSGGLSARMELKIKNRKLEILLYLVELFSSLSRTNEKLVDIENIWLKLLFNQDHNIIRGICTDEPYELATRRYNDALVQAEDILEEVIGKIASGLSYTTECQSFVVLNPVPWKRSDIVRIIVDKTKLEHEFFEIHDFEGNSVPYQEVVNQTKGDLVEIVFIAKDMPSLGYRVYSVVGAEQQHEFNSSIRTGKDWIESDDFLLELDNFSGAIQKLFDKKNQFEVLRDRGNYLIMENDMGDIYRYSRSLLSDDSSDFSTLRTSGKVFILETGPVRAVVEVDGIFANIGRKQRIVIYDGIHRLDFETELDFHGQNSRIRLCFPTTIFNSEVDVGAQFASEKRNTFSTDSASWVEKDDSCFSALDWVDITGPQFGVGISTIGLHEYELKDGYLKITLLRSIDYLSHGIDDDAILTTSARTNGLHNFRYSLSPHQGSWIDGKVWKISTEHRFPLIGYPLDGTGGNETTDHSFFSIEGLDLALSCFKPTIVDGEFIVRVYEIEGKSGTAKISFDKIVQSAKLIDLCEKEIGDLSFDDRSVSLPVEPHSILTMKVKLNE